MGCVAPAAIPVPPKAQTVRVITDVYDIRIDTRGGDLREVDLLAYPVSPKAPEVPVKLLNDQPPDIFIAQSGLRARTGTEPTHHVVYHAAQSEYRLGEGQDELVVELEWTSPEGVEVTKRYRFRRGDYLFDVEHEVKNGSAAEWQGRQYRQFQRAEVSPKGGLGTVYTYTGGVIYSPSTTWPSRICRGPSPMAGRP